MTCSSSRVAAFTSFGYVRTSVCVRQAVGPNAHAKLALCCGGDGFVVRACIGMSSTLLGGAVGAK
jgi:hypothetical protein